MYKVSYKGKASQVALVVKILHASSGDVRDEDLSLGLENPLEKGMATHCSILTWRIPWTEESVRLQSMGSHRVRHNCSDLAHMHMSYRGILYNTRNINNIS